jgi:hypothetical protein
MMQPLAVFGTRSDAGKTTLVAVRTGMVAEHVDIDRILAAL